TSAGTLGSYTYDFQGLRVSKQASAGGLEQYVYDDQSVLQRTSDSGRTTHYDYGPDRLLSVEDSQDGRAYYLFDALGSISDLTTLGGAVLARYQWDAWGNSRGQLDTAANPFGFTGHEHDDESGLIHAKARFYDPEIGLFLSHDPVFGDPSNPPSLHRYLYAFQNPTVFVDPDGRIPVVRNAAEFQERLADNPALIRPLAERFFGEGAADDIDLALAAAILERSSAGTRLINSALNAGLLFSVIEQDRVDQLTPEAREELAAELDSFLGFVRDTQTTINLIQENPLAAGAEVIRFAKARGREGLEFLKRALSGDEKAAFELEKTLKGLGLDSLTVAVT
ncbi:MAG: RHS repeat-associated core domain-containing protein, partial [Acidobacteriota bacterium]